MNYILKPSLEHIALVKITTILWNPQDIRDLLTKSCIPLHSGGLRAEWPKIEDVILSKVSQIPLPELLKKKILGFIRPIGLQILNWIGYHCNKLCFNIGVPDEFFWIPRGAIDKKKMAEMLITDEKIDITTRYKLACIYCIEGSIPGLWNEIPEDHKISFFNEDDLAYVMHHDLVVLWTHDIKGEVIKNRNMFQLISNHRCSPYQYAFEFAVNVGNEVAAEYFLHKLNSKEKEKSLIRAACSAAVGHFKYHYRRDYLREDHNGISCIEEYDATPEYMKDYYSDILCVLLSQMDVGEQEELFKSHSYEVLKCFLDWPRQVFFMETINRMWNYLTEWDYEDLLKKILYEFIENGYNDFNNQKIFGEIWQISPNTLKKYVLNTGLIFDVLLILFKIRDEKNIKLIFRDASLITKNRLIFSVYGINTCEDLIEGEKWGLLDLFILECLSSKEEALKFKENFRKNSHYALCGDDFQRRTKYEKFFRLLDEFICGFSKRKCVEDDGCKVKKLCTNF